MQGLWRRGALALLVLFCSPALATQARADEIVDVGPSPVLNLHVNRGQVQIETWNRPQVSIASDRPLNVRHLAPSEVDPGIPRQLQMESQTIQTEHGPVVLPAESFVLPELSPIPHDAVVANGTGNVTIMIPRGTAMVLAHQRGGHLTISNYSGVFIAHSHRATISLDGVSGTGFVESLKGRIVATNSTFERLRVRTATGDMLFSNCTSHQIQANSAYGSIVYDNGHFQPGLARFESDHGNVALGVNGSAQIGAHSESGHVVSSFRNEADVRGDLATKQARVRGGGPVVTATSKNGSVYLYSGSMQDHPRVRQELNGSVRLPGRFQPPPERSPYPHPPPYRRTRR